MCEDLYATLFPGLCRASRSDYALLDGLGLSRWYAGNRKPYRIGMVTLAGVGEVVKVEITVTCMPAQFYRFRLLYRDGDTEVVETGSGNLSTYLPILTAYVSGMLRLDETDMTLKTCPESPYYNASEARDLKKQMLDGMFVPERWASAARALCAQAVDAGADGIAFSEYMEFKPLLKAAQSARRFLDTLA